MRNARRRRPRATPARGASERPDLLRRRWCLRFPHGSLVYGIANDRTSCRRNGPHRPSVGGVAQVDDPDAKRRDFVSRAGSGSRAGEEPRAPSRITGWMTRRYSSTRPRRMNADASVAPPTFMSRSNSVRARAVPRPRLRDQAAVEVDPFERRGEHDPRLGVPDPTGFADRLRGVRIGLVGWPVGRHDLVQAPPVQRCRRAALLVVERRVQLVVDAGPFERVVRRLDEAVEWTSRSRSARPSSDLRRSAALGNRRDDLLAATCSHHRRLGVLLRYDEGVDPEVSTADPG